MNRDFKGVWIPKEIWLSTDLSLLEKVLLTEISSLDNEEHCTAGNEYFAEFCNCSQSAITKAIKHLKELGFIEELKFNGRIRQLRVVNFTTLPSKIYEAESENLRANNIYNNINNKKELDNISNDILSIKKSGMDNFEFGKRKTSRKPNLYNQCIACIDSHSEISSNLRSILIEYLQYRISIKDKPLYINMWIGMLNKLLEFPKNQWEVITKQSIELGYLSFYPLKSSGTKTRLSEPIEGTGCEQATEEDDRKRGEFIRGLREQGKRADF